MNPMQGQLVWLLDSGQRFHFFSVDVSSLKYFSMWLKWTHVVSSTKDFDIGKIAAAIDKHENFDRFLVLLWEYL